MKNGSGRKAVFLDRDGTIAEEVGYMNHLSRFRIYPFAAEAIRRLNEAGLPVVVVTNQAGVSRGFFPEEFLHRVHQRMLDELGAAGARIDAIYYCPHSLADSCACRKPRTGLLERAAAEHDLALERSYLVSDRFVDVEMAQSVGCHGILVMTGYGRGDFEWHHESWARQPDTVAEDLLDATDAILGKR